MRILVVGGGGREHALVWALSRSGGNDIICAPGNPGIGKLARLYPVEASDIRGMTGLAGEKDVDLVVVGPEAPLVAGLADTLRAAGIPCFGPGREASRMEGSKWFAKEIMQAAGVPTAEGEVFADAGSAMDYIGEDAGQFVIKADGLASGKGVFLPSEPSEAAEILNGLFSGKGGDSGQKVVVERRLIGREVSILAICSGTGCVVLPPSRDHKRLGDKDTGPNTGGMGAVCPPPELGEDFAAAAGDTIILPVLQELAGRGIDYRGVLYAGLMVTGDGPRVLEFNVRFGDPETQAVLPLLGSDLSELCAMAALGQPLPARVDVIDGACTCVVLASGGYPSSYGKGYPVSGTDDVEGAFVFHAGTTASDGGLVTAGGRVLSVAAVSDDLGSSIEKAYLELGKIRFRDCYFRTDIGR
ncbi:MAG: phosphoribosylamine--glycine ligase [Candidatus Fermentibacteraceae bacterium]|nr:phosphoribosylamine--glycine ligase [Candidatus Fermentibacteraceae bacterium]MBN2608128.1 phosphoribosylamine--glycine ligase [Candidatus Fermentibacteraceae bacterium]